MSAFFEKLRSNPARLENRRWVFVPYDQLTDALGPLSREKPTDMGVVLVENRHKAELRPYHKQKLALILANLRHFAVEQAQRGVAVAHLTTEGPYRNALEPFIQKHGPLEMMEPAERELRVDLQPLLEKQSLRVLPHEGWLTTEKDFKASQQKGPPFRMDAFYRHVRKATGILMSNGQPEGGKFSFDAENRQPWEGTPKAPSFPQFVPDDITLEVKDLVETQFSKHPGTLNVATLPATVKDAEKLWAWAKKQCLPLFGPYEDAMHQDERGLFHTRVSMLLNLHRLLPKRVVEEAEALELPLASKEGFIRQILGWREFVRHVHVATDGFRNSLRGKLQKVAGNFPLPPAYWGQPSGLHCLDTVVQSVWEEGYSHHITRLMVLSNIASLLDVSPRELTDWFWVAYVDAFDWVVEPNVLGMGTYSQSDLMITKPYISGAAYIDRMSNYCEGCQFHPKKNCPLTSLYWAYLARYEQELKPNIRMAQVMASLKKRAPSKRAEDEQTFRWMQTVLGQGKKLSPKT